MTYAERSHLYILLEAIRENLRGAGRYSLSLCLLVSPVYSLSTHPSPCYISRFSWSLFSFPAATPTISVYHTDSPRSCSQPFPFYPPSPSPRYLFNRAVRLDFHVQERRFGARFACHIQDPDLTHRKT